MAFSRKRGRPKASDTPERKDLGTQELIKKRAYQVTTEAIDMCLHKGLITTEQHWCALHLRWLYTLRYGVPSVKAIDPTHFGGKEIVADSVEWRREREREYIEALSAIGSSGRIKQILDLCIYGYRPYFLLSTNPRTTVEQATRQSDKMNQSLEEIREGLSALVHWWCRKKKAPISV